MRARAEVRAQRRSTARGCAWRPPSRPRATGSCRSPRCSTAACSGRHVTAGERAEPRWIDDDRALAELVSILVDEPAYGLDTEFMSERTLLAAAVPGAGVVGERRRAGRPARVRRARARNGAARAGHDDHARGRERPAHPRPRHRRATVGVVRRAARRRLRRARAAVARHAGVGAARHPARQVGAAGRLVEAPAVRGHPPLRRRRRRAPLPDDGRAAAPAAEAGPRGVGGERVRGAAHHRRPAHRSRRSRGGRSRARRRCAARRRASRSRSPAWRERRAQQLDVLPRFVLPDLALAAVVGRPPKTRDQLFALRGVNRLPNDVVRELLDVVEAGREMPKDQLRLPEKYDDGPELDAAVALLVAYVAELARARARREAVAGDARRREGAGLRPPEPPRRRLAGRDRRRRRSTASSTARPSSASPTTAATSASRTDPRSRTMRQSAELFAR